MKTETKHTPGPWRIVRDDDGCFEIADSDGRLINKTVARGGTVNRANARLIAAAPEMLEAVDGSAAILDMHPDDYAAWAKTDVGRISLAEARRACKAALAKAKGEV